ncbi:hypothetical protein FHR70_000718 [Microvirga lupini]|uniref:Uncharacterized protein n=1 Tax=Microvirga lupini TaxID=420324 RepID=A0A7W4YW59_9HYPH|nr:hypothetical protein [Microvirga lupini]MBB3017678.1 hypothetical protein [Microvirga lupini]
MSYQLEEAAALLDKELPDWSWSFTRIRNPGHAVSPFGEGVGLDLLGPDGKLRVYQKHGTSALEAARRAIPRARARLAGDSGA